MIRVARSQSSGRAAVFPPPVLRLVPDWRPTARLQDTQQHKLRNFYLPTINLAAAKIFLYKSRFGLGKSGTASEMAFGKTDSDRAQSNSPGVVVGVLCITGLEVMRSAARRHSTVTKQQLSWLITIRKRPRARGRRRGTNWLRPMPP